MVEDVRSYLRGVMQEHHDAVANDGEKKFSSFVRNVFSILERTEYRRCESGEDVENIYRLRYKAYRRTDMVPGNAEQAVYDELDIRKNPRAFGGFVIH